MLLASYLSDGKKTQEAQLIRQNHLLLMKKLQLEPKVLEWNPKTLRGIKIDTSFGSDVTSPEHCINQIECLHVVFKIEPVGHNALIHFHLTNRLLLLNDKGIERSLVRLQVQRMPSIISNHMLFCFFLKNF